MIKILQLLSAMILNTAIHELGHYIVLKAYRHPSKICFGIGKLLFVFKDLEFRAIPIVSYVEYDEGSKVPQLFYLGGVLGNLLLAIICAIFTPRLDWLCVYSIFIGLCNLFIIYPANDIYMYFDLDKQFKLTENQTGIWITIGLLISMVCITMYSIWFFFIN